MQAFASVSALLDKVIREEVHNEQKSRNSLYLVVGSEDPLFFYDISKIKLTVPLDDIDTYLNKQKLSINTTICLENCEITPEYGKDNEIVSCEIQSKSVVINAGTVEEKKTNKPGKLRLQVETDSGEIPLLASTRRYIRRMKKQEIARKDLKKTGAKVDLLSFFADKSSSAASTPSAEQNIFSEEIGPIDSESVKILQKLVSFIDKDELFNLLAAKPLKSKASKKAVRLMVIPNSKDTEQNSMTFRKKQYLREEVEELCRHYDNIDLEGAK